MRGLGFQQDHSSRIAHSGFALPGKGPYPVSVMEPQELRETSRHGRPGPRSIPAPTGGKRSPSPGIHLAGILLAAFLASSCSHAPLSAGPPPRFLPPKEVAAFPGAVLRVSFSPDGGQVALCGEDNAVRIFRTDTWEAERFLETASPRVREIGWNRSGDRIAAVTDEGLHVYGDPSGREIRFVRVHPPRARLEARESGADPPGFVWSPEGGHIAVAGFENAVVGVFSGAALEEEVLLKGHYRPVTSMTWDPDGTLYTGSRDGTVRRWDVTSGRGGFVTPNLGPGSIGLAWLGSIGALATMAHGDMAVLAWEIQTGKLRKKVMSSTPLVLFRPSADSGAMALADTERSIRIRGIPGWETSRVLTAEGTVEELRWSPDGRYLAGKAAGDPAVAVWDVATGGSTRLWVREEELISLDWSPDGRRLVTGGRSGKVREWVLAPEPERR